MVFSTKIIKIEKNSSAGEKKTIFVLQLPVLENLPHLSSWGELIISTLEEFLMAIVAKRTVMSLYTDLNDVYSHQVRIVLAEKGVNVEIHPVEPGMVPKELSEHNPYNTVPTLVDRELGLFEARIIMEYLDERFPHPPLLPVYPVARAESRKMMLRIERDWYALMKSIEKGEDVQKNQTQLKESLVALEPIFADKPYFLSEDFSILDCVVAPLFWRLPALGIELPESATAIKQYQERVFMRDSFQSSLTELERELREVA